jgi:hypothetical protein
VAHAPRAVYSARTLRRIAALIAAVPLALAVAPAAALGAEEGGVAAGDHGVIEAPQEPAAPSAQAAEPQPEEGAAEPAEAAATQNAGEQAGAPEGADAAAPGGEMEIEVARGINGRHESTLSGTLRVEGSVSRFVPGQQVTVHTYRRGKRVATREVTIRPGDDGTGRFVLDVRVVGSGHFVLRASHAATAQQGTMRAPGVGFDVLPTRLRGGDRGSRVSVVQKHLRELGYVTGRHGVYDARTRRAVLAFRKMTGMRRTSTASEAMLDRLAAGHGRFRVKHRNHGRHLEADLSRQVIALIGSDGDVERIYPTSTGTRSTPTVTGSFRVYRKDAGANSLGMVHSVYFIRGYAVHGYKSVPTYPASHGCLRVPIPDARSVYNWMHMGTRVDVYR